MDTPIPGNIVRAKIRQSRLDCVGLATIRELNRLVGEIEAACGYRFIRMEMGIPGLAPPDIAVAGEIDALNAGVGATYPPFDGIPHLKEEIARFVKLFLDIDVQPAHCLPTVGAMQGCFLSMMMAGRRIKGRDRILFIDPGFPVNKKQAQVLGLPAERFDVYDFRGDRLRNKLESHLSSGRIGALMYANPNNPAWICLTEKELAIIGDLCTRYDVIALEDLAYFGMDFRTDYSRPGMPPFIPTVARYTDHAILLISSSKSFSLAGQRIGMTVIADALFESTGDGLRPWFGTDRFGYAYIFGGMYALSAGVCHSTQYGLANLLEAVNDGRYNFVDAVKVYGERARTMKRLFTDSGFTLVYDRDEDQPLADGFYFTVAYPGFTGVQLVEALLYYGISAISLETTGSSRKEGIRACVSLTGEERFAELEDRLKRFDTDCQAGLRVLD
ncbi:MAG: pyridoxal phosphate-dependent aminotransferase [Desulfosarcina sp.]|jgi:aspartate/methionine/tyrosine aminotransferase